MNRLKLLVGALALAMLGSEYGRAQSGARVAPAPSEASRYLSQIRAENSASRYITEARTRGVNVNSGRFGGSVIQPPSSITAPRSRSASFGIGGGAPVAKPFSNVSPAPMVSPYLNLFRESFDGSSDLNYQTLVRPQLEQQQFNQQVSREAQSLNRRLTALSARSAYNIQGAETIAPTGHAATFNYYSRFYPNKGRRR